MILLYGCIERLKTKSVCVCKGLVTQWLSQIVWKELDSLFLRSLYRDILFLSLVALGKDNIDIGESYVLKYFTPYLLQIAALN